VSVSEPEYDSALGVLFNPTVLETAPYRALLGYTAHTTRLVQTQPNATMLVLDTPTVGLGATGGASALKFAPPATTTYLMINAVPDYEPLPLRTPIDGGSSERVVEQIVDGGAAPTRAWVWTVDGG
jgi:hypothetical protein